MSFDGSVPTGFQQTEIGPIPEDWGVVSLGAVSRVIRGSTPRPAGDPRYFNGSFVPWLTVGAITNSSASVIGIDRTDTFLTETGANHSTHFPSGCVVIANSGFSLGVAKILKIDACANDGVAALLNLSGVTAEFVTYSINRITERLRKEIGRGNDQPNLNTDIIRGIQISLPTLAEQKAIAEALSDVDALIADLEALVAKKRDLKQAAAQTLLTGKSRLPGFSEDWREVKLHDLAEIVSGGTPSSGKAEYWNGGIPWCTPTDITECEGNYLSTTPRTISEAGLADSAATMLPAGTILLCSRATLGDARIAAVPMTTNQGFKSLVAKTDVNGLFLYYLVGTLKAQMVELASGSTFLEISKKDLGSIEMLVPHRTEQAAIANVLSDMDAEIEALEAQLAKTRDLKTGMMQDLLTGRVRLTSTGERRAA